MGSNKILDAILAAAQSDTTLAVDRFGEVTNNDLKTMAAVFLVYIGRSDQQVCGAEQDALMGALAKQFEIPDQETEHILQVADFLVREPANLENFAAAMRESFEEKQLITLLAMMWRVSEADGLVTTMEAEALAQVMSWLGLEEEHLERAKSLYDEGQV